MFDYIYFRLNKFYRQKEKDGAPHFTAVLYLTFLQLLIVYFLIMNYGIITKDGFEILTWLRSDKFLSKLLILAAVIVLEIYNYFKYRSKKRQLVLKMKFENHPLNTTIPTWSFLALGGILLFGPFLIYLIIR